MGSIRFVTLDVGRSRPGPGEDARAKQSGVGAQRPRRKVRVPTTAGGDLPGAAKFRAGRRADFVRGRQPAQRKASDAAHRVIAGGVHLSRVGRPRACGWAGCSERVAPPRSFRGLQVDSGRHRPASRSGTSRTWSEGVGGGSETPRSGPLSCPDQARPEAAED